MTNGGGDATAGTGERERIAEHESDGAYGVPHEGLLGRIALSIVVGEAVVLLVVAIWGIGVSTGEGFFGRPDVSVLALRMNPAHATLLAITAILGLAAAWYRTWLRAFAGIQAGLYVILFAFGTAYSVGGAGPTFLNLNTPADILHGVLALLGFVAVMLAGARTIEPPAAPVPYPGGE